MPSPKIQSLMMNSPLTITSILRHAESNNPGGRIVSVTADHPRHETTYAQAFSRARQLADALVRRGMQAGDRVGTLAWNDFRHFEVYYATSGMGAICHTINPRLFAEQLVYIINHAADRWLLADPVFLPLLEKLAPELKTLEGIFLLTGAAVPESAIAGLQNYESLLAEGDADFEWPELDEHAPSSMCYTSGTTGNPKGVVYSHRSTVLHSMASCLPDMLNLSVRDTVLPVVPMFHVNAWGLPYSVPMVGGSLVFPGPKMADGETLQRLIVGENVTMTAGVPTVWLALLQYLEASGKDLGRLNRTVVGGAACPRAIMQAFRDRYGVDTLHAWGMTEMSPLGTVNQPLPHQQDLSGDAWLDLKAKQGRAVFGVEMKIVDDDDNELPRDGKAFGALKVRGPWVCSAYYERPESDAHDADGWFSTGDVATIDADGFMQITDRTKDVIKSGGEWISSIELENIAVGHPDVLEAAVIGVPHPKWDERPLLVVVRRAGAAVSPAELLGLYEGRVAKFCIPDAVEFVEAIPHTATGKIQKMELRSQFAGYRLADG